MLRSDHDDAMTTDAALRLAVRVLSKTMDSASLSADKVELATVTRDAATGAVHFRIWEEGDMKALLEEVNAAAAKEKETEEGK